MSTWATVLAASAVTYLIKLVGHLVPAGWLSGSRTTRLVALLPVALLTALVATQAFVGAAGDPTLDARAAAVAVAVVALALRAPFLLVVLLAAATAAILRACGLA
ncbi:MAG: AzlD domain-containing protein [Dermatophilaceae bacterium]